MTAFGEERRKPIPMEQLTGFNSNFFVPHPYPKTRKEIIDNIKFKLAKKSYDTDASKRGNFLLDIIEGKTTYRVGRIMKIQNRISLYSHDYFWLILIMDKKDNIHFTLNMRANGILTGIPKHNNSTLENLKGLLKTRREILSILSGSIGKPFKLKEVKMHRVSFEQSNLAYIWAPMWEIRLNDGTIYYYSTIKNTIHEIEGKIPYDKTIWNPKSIVPKNRDFAVDTVSDEILVLKRL